MQTTTRRRSLWLLLLVAVALLFVGACTNDSGSEPKKTESSNSTTDEAADKKDKSVDEDCATKVHFYAKDAKVGSNDFGQKLKGKNTREKLDDLQSRYCSDAALVVADAQHFAEKFPKSGLDEFKNLDEQGRLAKTNELLKNRKLWRETVQKLMDIQNDSKTKVELVTLKGHYKTMEMIPQSDGKPPLIRVVNVTATAESLKFTMSDGTVLYLQTTCGGQPREQLATPKVQGPVSPVVHKVTKTPPTPPTTPPGPPTKTCKDTGTCTTSDCTTTPNAPQCQPKEDCVKADHPQPGPDYVWDETNCRWNPPTDEECFPTDHPKPGPDYTWDQSTCSWKPPVCVKPQSPGQGYTWDEATCSWIPPICVKPASPGPDYTWDESSCSWKPPVCVKPASPGEGYVWDQEHCRWNPPTDECVKPVSPGAGYEWDQEHCKWFKPPQSDDCMLNGGPNCPPKGVVQPPQDNGTSGVDTGPTPGADNPPPPAPPAPVDNSDDDGNATPPPPPTNSGSDSGASDGSGTPDGTHTGGGDTTTQPPAQHDDTVGDANGGNNGTDGTDSTGDGQIDNPFGTGDR